MEHTHLVKGLDFALLQKVRSEIIHRETSGNVNNYLNFYVCLSFCLHPSVRLKTNSSFCSQITKCH